MDRLQNGDLIFSDASEDMDGIGKSVEIQNAIGIELVAGLHTIAIRFDKSVLEMVSKLIFSSSRNSAPTFDSLQPVQRYMRLIEHISPAPN